MYKLAGPLQSLAAVCPGLHPPNHLENIKILLLEISG